MNIPPVFTALAAASDVTDIIGTNPVRCYLFGEAPQDVAQPFVTWTIVSSVPENCLEGLPVVDNDRVQVDCWARDPLTCINLATAVRDTLEAKTHMINKLNMQRDPDTRYYRWMLEFSFWTGRS